MCYNKRKGLICRDEGIVKQMKVSRRTKLWYLKLTMECAILIVKKSTFPLSCVSVYEHMIKRTHRTFTPEEFRKLNQCLRCGRLEDIEYGTMCEACKLIDIQSCDICEILLRMGEYRFYTYHTSELLLSDTFLISKNSIKEFSYIKIYPLVYPAPNLCHDCIDWEYKMKSKCVICKKKFPNDKQHYKENGNVCDNCAI